MFGKIMFLHIISLIILTALFYQYSEIYNYAVNETNNSFFTIFCVTLFFLVNSKLIVKSKNNQLENIYFYLLTIPAIALFLVERNSLHATMLCLISSSIVSYTCGYIKILKLYKQRFPFYKFKRYTNDYYIIFVSIIFLFISLYTLQLDVNLNLLLLDMVYDTRFEVEEYHNIFTLYLGGYFSKFVFTILLINFLYRKKYLISSLIILFFIFYYLATSLKTTLFIPIMVIYFR